MRVFPDERFVCHLHIVWRNTARAHKNNDICEVSCKIDKTLALYVMCTHTHLHTYNDQ